VAVEIVQRILVEKKLKSNKLISVIPCGGWKNVLNLHTHFLNHNLFAKPTKYITILDGDVENDAKQYLNENTIDLLVSYLPLQSLEKYLKKNLCDEVNHDLFRQLSDYIFYKNSLSSVVRDYAASGPYNKNDKSGKAFFQCLNKELEHCGRTKETLVEFVVKYIIERNGPDIQKISSFLVDAI